MSNTPSETSSAHTEPSKTAPTDTERSDTAPPETKPSDTAPAQTEPSEEGPIFYDDPVFGEIDRSEPWGSTYEEIMEEIDGIFPEVEASRIARLGDCFLA